MYVIFLLDKDLEMGQFWNKPVWLVYLNQWKPATQKIISCCLDLYVKVQAPKVSGL